MPEKSNHVVITITLDSEDGNYILQKVTADGGSYSWFFAERAKKFAKLTSSLCALVFSGKIEDDLMEEVLFHIRRGALSPKMQSKICDDFCPANRVDQALGEELAKPDADNTVGSLFKDILSFLGGLNPDMTEKSEMGDTGEVTLPPEVDEALKKALRKDDDNAKT